MLSLDSPRWAELRHAYGTAGDIPALLRQLFANPRPVAEAEKEPWYSLWSTLAHQGDVYEASFASVPHVIAAIAEAPEHTNFSYFGFPSWVEICRKNKNVAIPADLAPAYFTALAQLPGLVARAATQEWDDTFLATALSAIAVAKGNIVVAEAVSELTTETAGQYLTWLYAQ